MQTLSSTEFFRLASSSTQQFIETSFSENLKIENLKTKEQLIEEINIEEDQVVETVKINWFKCRQELHAIDIIIKRGVVNESGNDIISLILNTNDPIIISRKTNELKEKYIVSKEKEKELCNHLNKIRCFYEMRRNQIEGITNIV